MSTAEPRRRRRRRRRLFGTLILVALVVVAAYLVLARRGGPPPTRVVVVAVERTAFVREVSGTGIVQPAQERRLSFPSAGTVARLPVAEGDRVPADAELASLDTTALERDLASNRSSLASARADLERVRAQQRVDRLDLQNAVSAAQNQVADAERTLQDAAGKLTASERLAAAGGASRDELRAARDARDAAERRLAQARQALDSARAKLETADRLAEAQIASGEANVARFETAVANQQQQIRDATLRAPFAGVVSAVPFKVGDTVAPGATQGIDLVDDRSVSVRAQFDENRALELAVGQTGSVTPDAAPDLAIGARVTRVSPVADRAQGAATVQAELSFSDAARNGVPEGALRPGYTVTARVVVNRIEDALVVPLEAVVDRGEARTIYRVRTTEPGRGVVEAIDVSVTDRNATLAAVAAPSLAPGDLIAVTELDAMRDGEAVSFAPPDGGGS